MTHYAHAYYHRERVSVLGLGAHVDPAVKSDLAEDNLVRCAHVRCVVPGGAGKSQRYRSYQAIEALNCGN